MRAPQTKPVRPCCKLVGIKSARHNFPAARFECFDVLADKSRLQALARSGLNGTRCRQVYLDIGGDRSLHMIARIIPLLEQAIEPDLIVVKSEELKTHADTVLVAVPPCLCMEKLTGDIFGVPSCGSQNYCLSIYVLFYDSN